MGDRDVKALTARQANALKLLASGFVSEHTLGSMGSLVSRGLVEDLGLYDRERKRKRRGAQRYRLTPSGRTLIRNGRA